MAFSKISASQFEDLGKKEDLYELVVYAPRKKTVIEGAVRIHGRSNLSAVREHNVQQLSYVGQAS